jgi:catechol 2,3-dioxygenase-like lactoylglutathione lyase family enzyme
MEIKSISGLTCYVKDLEQTIAFYEALGFRTGERTDDGVTFYVNWFSVRFQVQSKEEKSDFQKEANAEPKGSGIYINLKVDNADETYKEIIEKGLKPSSEPRDWPWGNREFVLRDPDGYKLVFFQKR